MYSYILIAGNELYLLIYYYIFAIDSINLYVIVLYYIYRFIGLTVRVFTKSPGDRGSILGRVILNSKNDN